MVARSAPSIGKVSRSRVAPTGPTVMLDGTAGAGATPDWDAGARGTNGKALGKALACDATFADPASKKKRRADRHRAGTRPAAGRKLHRTDTRN